MLTQLIHIFNQEILSFTKIKELEVKKRISILAADGMQVQKITGEIEKVLLEIGHWESNRESILEKHPEFENSIEKIIGHFSQKEALLSSQLKEKSQDLKKILNEIKVIVKENEELLIRTQNTIHKILTGLQPKKEKVYGPAYLKSNSSAESLLISANA